jgi:hypothetical protein
MLKTENGFTVTSRFAEEIAGPEDFEVDLTSQVAPRLLVSAFDRQHDGRGGLYAIPFGDNGPGTPELLTDQIRGCPLRPHGISLDQGEDGVLRLYAINHRRKADAGRNCLLPLTAGGRPLLHTVEIFTVGEDGGLRHEETLADPLIASPNEIFATPDGQLYVSNEINAHSVVTKLLEFFQLRVTSNVIHYRNGRWRIVLTGPRYANGLAVHDDRFYVAGSMDEVIDIHRRDPATGDIGERIERIRFASAVDNLLWGLGPGGVRDHTTLYTAGHPDRLKYMRYKFIDPQAPSPSDVYRINLAASPARVERIYYDDGRLLSGASVAVVYRGDLYAGQFWGNGLFRITRDTPQVEKQPATM